MAIVWTNNQVALTKDLVFGLCVMSEEGWVPINEGTDDQIQKLFSLIDWNPSCPKDWVQEIIQIMDDRKKILVPS